MPRVLGAEPDEWNELAAFGTARSFVERELDRWVTRTLLPDLTFTELRAFCFVKSRTLGWQKFAEAIPMKHFIHGLRDNDGHLLRDVHGTILSAGAGIGKEDTVKLALDGLAKKGLLTAYRAPTGSRLANVYMAVSARRLGEMFIAGGAGILPRHHPHTVPGEHVIYDQRLWQVLSVEEGRANLQQIREGRRAIGPMITISILETFRPSPDQWETLRKCKILDAA